MTRKKPSLWLTRPKIPKRKSFAIYTPKKYPYTSPKKFGNTNSTQKHSVQKHCISPVNGSTPKRRRIVSPRSPYSTNRNRSLLKYELGDDHNEVKRHPLSGNIFFNSKVVITTDGWTSRSTESYVTVTSTHVNDDWEMVNYVLMTRCMPDNHTGENIAVFLKEALAEWGIPERPLYIVSDNASNMTKAAEVLSCDFHLGCFAHTLNLAAQKGLRVKAISHLLARIRKIVGYFHRSTVAASLLQVQATNLGLPNHKLIIDVQTRWNSAFDMLERYLEMQVAVVAALISSQLNNVRDKDLKFLADEEITLATLVMETMRPLKQVTTMLCSEKNPTVSTILPLQFKLLKVYQERLPGECSAITSLKSAIADDLKNRYNAGNTQVLMKATVLDPRFKSLPHLSSEQAFATYNDLVRELASNFPNGVVKQEADLHSSQCSQAPNVVVDTEAVQTLPALPTLPDLEENVKSSNDDCSSVSTNPPTPKKAKNDSVLVDLLGDVFVTKVVNMISPIERAENEIKKYKELPCLPLEGNPFSWWKENEHLLPILSQMAKQLLCIPSTSVPSERVFSTAGGIITAQRASLKAKTVDMLIFLKKNSSSIT